MLEVIIFIFNCMVDWVAMLFTIDFGWISIGTFLAVSCIAIPAIYHVFAVIRDQVPLSDRYHYRKNKSSGSDD